MAAIVWLLKRFEFKCFPLANNVQKIPKGEEKDGFGVALYFVRDNTNFAQGSSYLGVILEELKIFERVTDQGPTIKWKLFKDNTTPIGRAIDILEKTVS